MLRSARKITPVKVPTYHIRNIDAVPPRPIKAHNIVFHGIQSSRDVFTFDVATTRKQWPIFYARNVVYDNCHDQFIRATMFKDVLPKVRAIYLYEASAHARIPAHNLMSLLLGTHPNIFTTSDCGSPYPHTIVLSPEEMEEAAQLYLYGPPSDEEGDPLNSLSKV